MRQRQGSRALVLVAVVRAGLEPNGFVFASADVAGIDDALTRAMNMWYTRNPQWRQLVSRVMRQDWSWYSPSLDYVELYYRAMRS